MKMKSFMAALLVGIAMTAVTNAQSTVFTFQGSLNLTGTPANGNFDFEFTLFDALSGGSQSQTIAVTNVIVTNGIFNVRLDFGDSVFPGANRFLEIRVRQVGGGSYTTLTPRQPVTSSPYSIQSLNAGNATNSAQLGGISAAGFIRNTATLQPSSNFNISGNGLVGGNVGIGTTAPARRLHVASGTSGATSLSSSDFVIEDDTAAFQHFLTPNDVESGILFGDPAGSVSGGIIFNNAATDNGIQFRSGGNTTRMTLDGSGSLGIGTASPAAKLEVSGGSVLNSGAGARFSVLNPANQSASVNLDWINNTPRIRYGGSGEGSQNGFVIQGPGDATKLEITPNGSIIAASSVVATSSLFVGNLDRPVDGNGPLLNVCAENAPGSPIVFKLARCDQSSLRFKEDVHDFNPGLSIITRLRPVIFRWKERKGTEFGLIAEEVAQVEPQITFSNAKGEIEGVRYDRIGVVLINAVKEQQAQIEKQKNQTDSLKQIVSEQAKTIEGLRAEIDALKQIFCAAESSGGMCRNPRTKEPKK